jgi:hypothetical protein
MVAIKSGCSPLLSMPHCEVIEGPLTSESNHLEPEPFWKISKIFIISHYFCLEILHKFPALAKIWESKEQ